MNIGDKQKTDQKITWRTRKSERGSPLLPENESVVLMLLFVVVTLTSTMITLRKELLEQVGLFVYMTYFMIAVLLVESWRIEQKENLGSVSLDF